MGVGWSAHAIPPAGVSTTKPPPASGEDRGTSPLPVGIMLSAVIVAFVVGAGSAKLVHDAAPALAWLTAIGLCGGLFLLARLSTGTAPTRARVLAVLALACLSFSYLLVLGGESTPRPAPRSAVGFFTLLVMLLGIVTAAAALLAVILAGAPRSKPTAERHRPAVDFIPQLLVGALGAATALLGFVLLAMVLWASPPRWRVAAIVTVAIGSPALLVPYWAFMYKRLVSRWHVSPPRALMVGLERLRDLTGFTFDQVLCLQTRFGSGRVCQVVARPGRSTLLISESIPGDLTPPQLLALLAHEAAHVCLNHFRRKLAWGALAGMLGLVTAVAAQMAVAPFLPRDLGVAGVLVVVLPIGSLHSLYWTFVVRHHEAEADEFAVVVAGAPALLEALGVLGGSGPSEALVHNRWTTHGTWERRARRIREWERSRIAG